MFLWGTTRTCVACARITVQKRLFHATLPAYSKRDPHDVLGVKRGAAKNAIKKAYLDKAKTHHPDQNPGGSATAFLEIQEAYESLQGIITVKSYTSTTYSPKEEETPRTRGHGFATDDDDVYNRSRRGEREEEGKTKFYDTVEIGHIPLVFVAEWDSQSSILSLRTHSFKSRAHPNDPMFRNEEATFATVRHSKLDNGAPSIDLVWNDGNVIAKSYSQTNAKFHNPKTNASVPKNTTDKSGTISISETKKMTMDEKMVVEDAEGALMGHMITDNSWLKRGLRIENAEGIKVGRASWPRFSSQMIEGEDEFGKKVATGILQDSRWVVHLSPLASFSPHEVSPLFWILACFWAQKH